MISLSCLSINAMKSMYVYAVYSVLVYDVQCMWAHECFVLSKFQTSTCTIYI